MHLGRKVCPVSRQRWKNNGVVAVSRLMFILDKTGVRMKVTREGVIHDLGSGLLLIFACRASSSVCSVQLCLQLR